MERNIPEENINETFSNVGVSLEMYIPSLAFLIQFQQLSQKAVKRIAMPTSSYLAQPNYVDKTLPFMQDYSALYPNVMKNTF